LRALPRQNLPSEVVVPGLLEGLTNVSRLVAPWMEPAEEEHHLLLVGAEREARHVDGVVHRPPPGQVRRGPPLRRRDGDELSQGRLVVDPCSEETHGEHVALGTNIFPNLVKRVRPFLAPVYDFALMTEPLSESQQRAIGWSHRQGVSDLGNQFHYYRPSADGRILFGGYDAVYRYGGDGGAHRDTADATHCQAEADGAPLGIQSQSRSARDTDGHDR